MISSGTDFTVQPIIVPEPTTYALLLIGMGVLAVRGAPKRQSDLG